MTLLGWCKRCRQIKTVTANTYNDWLDAIGVCSECAHAVVG